jgi:PAS domain S-box-containing protein
VSNLRSAAARLSTDQNPRRRWAATGIALLVLVGLTLLDAMWSDVISATVVVAPFIAAMFAGVRQTVAIAVAASLSALLSGIWNDNFGDAGYEVRAGIVVFGGVFSVLAARTRKEATSVDALGTQLSAALSSLAEAVVVQDRDQRLVYANEAAAETLGFPSVDALLGATPQELVALADYYNEDGSPLTPEQYPSRRVLAGEEVGPHTLRVINRTTGEERWRVNKARGVVDARGETELVVTVIEDITEQKRAELAARLLARGGEALSSSLNYQRTLQEVADLAVPSLADWCGVSMPDRHGLIEQVAVAHSDPEKVAFARSYSERYPSRTSDAGGSAQVLRDGHSQLIPEISDAVLDAAVDDPEQRDLLRAIGMRSAISVPMTAATGRAIGVISFINAESGRVFTEAELELCEELGRRAGIAVENARLYTERSLIAHTLQRALLPPALPDIPGFGLSALYRPAGEENWVGGDFYDAFAVRDGWVAIVGDVAGRGAQAASLTAFARHVFRTAAQLHDDPLDAVAYLNRQLYDRPGSALCTVCCVHLRPRGADAEATIVCGGHPLPYAVRQAGVAEPVGRWGQMLGAWPQGEWSRTTTTVAAGDVLVLYTDGVIDATGAEDRFGDERLQAVLCESSDADDALRRLADGLADFETGEQADDTAALAIARLAPAGAGAAAAGRRTSTAAG